MHSIDDISKVDEWLSVPELAQIYSIKAAAVFNGGFNVTASFDPYRQVWFNPETKNIWFSWSPQDNDYTKQTIKMAFATHADKHVDKIDEKLQEAPSTLGKEPWMRVKLGVDTSTILRPIGQATGWLPGGPITPSPLAAMIGTGLLGAGTGYLGGVLAEKLAPEIFERNKLRKRTAILGGILGVLPGAWWASANLRVGKPINDPWPHNQPINTKAASNELAELSAGPIVTNGLNLAPLLQTEAKYAAALPLYAPIVPVDQFNMMLWQDNNTPIGYRAAAVGLVDAASASRGGVELVSPADIGRIAVGAGSGYLSGMLVGKILGALAGITPEAQRTLQQAGTWSGIIRNVLPMAFGG